MSLNNIIVYKHFIFYIALLNFGSLSSQIKYPQTNLPSDKYWDDSHFEELVLDYPYNLKFKNTVVTVEVINIQENGDSSATFLLNKYYFNDQSNLVRQINYFSPSNSDTTIFTYDESSLLVSVHKKSAYSVNEKYFHYSKNKIHIVSTTFSNLDTFHLITDFIFDKKQNLLSKKEETFNTCKNVSIMHDNKSVIERHFNNCELPSNDMYYYKLNDTLNLFVFNFPSGEPQISYIHFYPDSRIKHIYYVSPYKLMKRFDFQYNSDFMVVSILVYEKMANNEGAFKSYPSQIFNYDYNDISK